MSVRACVLPCAWVCAWGWVGGWVGGWGGGVGEWVRTTPMPSTDSLSRFLDRYTLTPTRMTRPRENIRNKSHAVLGHARHAPRSLHPYNHAHKRGMRGGGGGWYSGCFGFVGVAGAMSTSACRHVHMSMEVAEGAHTRQRCSQRRRDTIAKPIPSPGGPLLTPSHSGSPPWVVMHVVATHLYAPTLHSAHRGPVYHLLQVPLGPPRHAVVGTHCTKEVEVRG
jgi:hypothetical protein